MAKFMKCPTPDVEYRGGVIRNSVINADHVVTLDKDTFAGCSDNTGLPAILFRMTREDADTKWAFKTENDRDRAFDAILEGRLS